MKGMPVPRRFNADGLLPPRDYVLTLYELERSLLVVGPGAKHPNWDRQWRAYLVGNVRKLAGQLHQAGVTEIYIDGSFVEDTDHPGDIDGYFHCDMRDYFSGELQRRLNLIAPDKIWIWTPATLRPSPHDPSQYKLPMWHKYRVELFPHWGQLCGIRDAYGHELEFPSAFRQSRRGFKPKGIIKIGGLL